MMKITVGALLTLVSLSWIDSPGAPRRTLGSVANSVRTLPVRLSDLTLDRAFNYAVPLPAPIPWSSSTTQFFGNECSCTTQFPTDTGAAITEISGIPNQQIGGTTLAVRVIVLVDGVRRRIFSIPNLNSVGSDRYEFNPPVIVKPGQALTIDILPGRIEGSGNTGWGQLAPPASPNGEFTVAGWWLLPGEAGN